MHESAGKAWLYTGQDGDATRGGGRCTHTGVAESHRRKCSHVGLGDMASKGRLTGRALGTWNSPGSSFCPETFCSSLYVQVPTTVLGRHSFQS